LKTEIFTKKKRLLDGQVKSADIVLVQASVLLVLQSEPYFMNLSAL
jgi:hypothetical protein